MAPSGGLNTAMIIAGDVRLEAEINLPTTPRPDICAVIAHPYGFLGGSMGDSVVQAVTGVFVNAGIPTVVYNSRGVGQSDGQSSWTGEPEKRDYQVVVAWALANLGAESDSTVICCGYSYGSLMAAMAEDVVANRKSLDIKYRYVLISPPVGVSWILTPFRTVAIVVQLRRVLQRGSDPTILLLYGDQDNFTSVSAFRRWTSRLRERGDPSDGLQVVEVPDTNHFWPSPGRERMLKAIDAFIRI